MCPANLHGSCRKNFAGFYDRPQKWAQWIFSVGNVWQEDSPMPDRPLTVHCSGLGGGLVTHEYAIYQLFSTALGWSAWRAFLPDKFANHKLLITRAIRLLTAATIRPAHARPPHPTWVTAVRQIFRCYHPQGKLLFLRACFPQYVTVLVPDGIRDVDVLGLRDRILGSQSMKCSMNLIASRVPPR